MTCFKITPKPPKISIKLEAERVSLLLLVSLFKGTLINNLPHATGYEKCYSHYLVKVSGNV